MRNSIISDVELIVQSNCYNLLIIPALNQEQCPSRRRDVRNRDVCVHSKDYLSWTHLICFTRDFLCDLNQWCVAVMNDCESELRSVCLSHNSSITHDFLLHYRRLSCIYSSSVQRLMSVQMFNVHYGIEWFNRFKESNIPMQSFIIKLCLNSYVSFFWLRFVFWASLSHACE